MTVKVNVYEAKTNFSKLLELVQQGERVIISKNGKPVADLVFHEPTRVRLGTMRGEFHFDQDAFDAADVEIAEMWDPELGVEVPHRDPA